MIPYLGDFAEDETVYIGFNTFDSEDPSKSVTITNLADADLKVHKDGSTTQIVTDGATIAIDFDSITGNHLATIDTSAHADYSVGSDYMVRMEGTTVDGATINAWIGHFSIENRFNAAADDLANGTDGLGALLAACATVTGHATAASLATAQTDLDTITGSDGVTLATTQGNYAPNIVVPDVAGTAATPAEVATALSDFWTSPATLVDLVWDEQLTVGSHNAANSAGRRLRNVQDFGIYDLATVWVDETSGSSSGTTDGEDATVTNRADDFDNAQTVAASVGLDRIHIQSGDSITLTATLNGYEIWGELYTIALNSQDVGTTVFKNANISGIGTGTTPQFNGCDIGTTTISPSTHNKCTYTATLTAGSNGDYFIHDPKSGVAGSGSPTFDFTTNITGATNLNVRNYFGGGTWQLNSNVTASIEVVKGGGHSIAVGGADVEFRGDCRSITLTTVAGTSTVQIIADTGPIAINGTGGTVNIWGSHGVVTDNSGASVTINDYGMDTNDIDDILTDTNELQADWANDGRLDNLLDSASSAGDPWSTAIPGAYGAGTAGKILGDNIDATVSSAATATGFATEAKQDIIDTNIDQIETAVITNAAGVDIAADIIAVKAETALIVADSDELQTDWADGGRLDLIQDIIAADTTTDIPALIAGLENIAASDVLTQVNAALDTAIAELGVAAPTATPTLRTGLMLMYMMARNRVDVDTTGTDAMKIYNDAGTQITSKAITDDGTDYSEAEMS